METKLSQVLAAMDAEDWTKALSIASKFADLGDQKADIRRAQSCLLSPSFYVQIGLEPSQIFEAGKRAMKARFEPMRARA